MIPDQLHPLLTPLDLKEYEGSYYRADNRLELRIKQFRLAEYIIQVREVNLQHFSK